MNPTSILEMSRVRDTKNAERGAKAEEHEAPPHDGPEIIIRPNHLPQAVDEAEAALIKAKAPVFVRGGQLVRPVAEEDAGVRGRRVSVARLRPIAPITLVEMIERAAVFRKWDARKRTGLRLAGCPDDVAKALLAREGQWKFPCVDAVRTCATIAPDGRLIAAGGYDEGTRLLLVEPLLLLLPLMPDHPTRDDAVEALAKINNLLSEFPFADEASRSVALSLILSLTARPAMAATPLHAISAPAAGTGKSYLVDLASVLATGQPAPAIAWTGGADEAEKRLASALESAQPLIAIDNVNGELGGDLLCQAIDRPLIQIRPLGKTATIRIPNTATIAATGNNLQIVGDLVRRTIVCRLDPKVEQPEARKFKGDPLGEVAERRGEFLAAALTVTRAYILAGSPRTGDLPPLGGFEDWSQTVRGALIWLDHADPVDSQRALREDDPELSILATLLDAIAKDIGTGPENAFCAAAFCEKATDNASSGATPMIPGATPMIPGATPMIPGAFEAVIVAYGRGSSDRAASVKVVSGILQRFVGRVVDGRRLVRINGTRAMKFFVEDVR